MKYAINLFPQKEQDAVDKIVYFAFHYLRYILVVTQFVVICVFFFRFKVDQEIVDLRDSLTQKKQIVEATETMLEEVAYLEEKTSEMNIILSDQENYFTLVNYFIESLPLGLNLTSITIRDTAIECAGFSENPAIIQGYYQKLQAEGRFETVELANVQKTATGFSFTLKLVDFKMQVSEESS